MKKLLAVLVVLAATVTILTACETARAQDKAKAEPAKAEAKPAAAATTATAAKPDAASATTAAPAAPKAGQKVVEVKDGKATVKINDKKQITEGAEKWSGPDDCSAVATIEKTADGIVATIDVTDDKLVFQGPAESVHMSDSIEFYLDERLADKRGKAYYAKGVVQIQVMPVFGKADIVKCNTGGDDTYTGDIPGLKTESKKTDKGYQVKLTIPAAGLAKNHCALGDSFAFDIGVNDADSGPERDTQLMAFGTTENWQNPSGFAVVDFSKK